MQCGLWMLPPGCTRISAHQTQRHIFPWCRAREKQKGEGKHMFQEATCKITMELCAGEKNCHLHLAPEVLSCRRRTAREKRGTSRQSRKKHPHEQQNCWAMLTLPPRFSCSLGKEQFPDKPSSINKCRSAGLRWKAPHCSEYAKKAELLEVDCWLGYRFSHYCLTGEGAGQGNVVSVT